MKTLNETKLCKPCSLVLILHRQLEYLYIHYFFALCCYETMLLLSIELETPNYGQQIFLLGQLFYLLTLPPH